MCPPASDPSAVELGEYPTDEVICKLLMQLQSGHTLPGNVLSDVDPYQTVPSNLPPEMWYFLPGPKIDTKNGVWRSTGEACEIYSTSLIVGLRRTLQFYEGPTHDGQKTNWTMQEYTTTEVYTGKPDAGALCRVFLVDDSSSEGHLSKSELVKNTDVVAGQSDLANQSSNHRLDDCILEGAFLEMDDLDAPLSRTTSSADSSCMTMSMTSEEFFDIDALLRELGDDDTVDQEIRDPRIKLNLCAPAKLKQVVIQPTTLGSLDNAKESEPPTGQTSKTTPTPEDKSTSNEVDTSAAAAAPPLSSSPPPPPPPPPVLPPSSSPPPSSSNSSEGSSKEEKKDHADRTKKRRKMKFLCFFAF